jgi:hypothetical protein
MTHALPRYRPPQTWGGYVRSDTYRDTENLLLARSIPMQLTASMLDRQRELDQGDGGDTSVAKPARLYTRGYHTVTHSPHA